MGIYYCTLWMTFQCDLQWSLILYLPVQALKWCFRFYWFLYIDKTNVNRGRWKGYWQKLIKFNHKVKHKTGCYHKCFLISTAYQVQWRCTIILGPLKYQPDGITVKNNPLKRLWHTYLKHSKPYTFIFKKWISL